MGMMFNDAVSSGAEGILMLCCESREDGCGIVDPTSNSVVAMVENDAELPEDTSKRRGDGRKRNASQGRLMRRRWERAIGR